MNPIIETIKLTKKYKMGEETIFAVNNVDLSVAPGEFIAIVGPSGAGKSTLLNLIAGLDQPSSGEVIVDGESLQKKNPDEFSMHRRNMVGMIFQSFNLITSMNALENVELPLVFSGIGINERKERANEVLLSVGLEKRLLHKPTELSGGEQQRVAIARAIVNQPRILLADEPTGNLDSETSLEIIKLLYELNQKMSKTIITVTHDEKIITSFATRVNFMLDGKIIDKTCLPSGRDEN